MNIEGKTIWEQAAGDGKHDYVDLCFDWDVILNGGTRSLYRFQGEMKNGDIVVLRNGMKRVYGVGEIVGSYEWCEDFNDVDGWSIGHVRRVRWLWNCRKSNKKGEPKEFRLKRGDTTRRLTSDEVKRWIKIEVSDTSSDHEMRKLPQEGDSKEVTVDDIQHHLFDKGLSWGSISNLVSMMRELGQISAWYNAQGKISEHETTSYLCIPLLRALGWTPQRMAIEWHKIDIALFSSLPREPKSLSVVLEAKSLWSSPRSALGQAQSYAGRGENCNRIIVTDGLRYGVFSKKATGEFRPYPDAYLNLTRLRDRYPIYDSGETKCEGAAEALFMMSPEWR